jgi:hypothetical protein
LWPADGIAGDAVRACAPPRTSGHALAELAIDFYRANCVGCPHRDPSGLLPTLATLVADRAREEKARQEAADRAARERSRRHEIRRERRRALVAGESYVIRDLAQSLDRLDGPDPRREKPSDQEKLAARQVAESARHAPDLFSPPLVESMLEMARQPGELFGARRAQTCLPQGGVRKSGLHRVVDHQITRRGGGVAGERQALRHTPIEELSALSLKGGGDHEPEFID